MTDSPMRILITNDDGIHSPGLEACEKIARALSDDVWIVAPETDQSGVSHSLSLNDPLRMREVGERHYAIKGTPTDCVIMGVRHLMKDKPDLVLSGVNRGRNCRRGCHLFRHGGRRHGRRGARHSVLRALAGLCIHHQASSLLGHCDQIRSRSHQAHSDTGMPRDVLVNINFPDCLPGEVAGVAVAVQGKRDQELLRIEARHDGRGNPYYWIAFGRGGIVGAAPGSDLAALNEKRISVTPLRLDLTDEPFMTKLASVLA